MLFCGLFVFLKEITQARVFKWGLSVGDEKKQVITIVSDSLLQFGDEHHETLLPCSPNGLPATDAALQTLRDLDEHEKSEKDKALQEEMKLKALVCI